MAKFYEIFDFHRGDYCSINFPEGFTLETKSGRKFECARMSVYRYDEDDRDDTNYYFYSAENPQGQWVAKSYHLTEQSYDKVCAHLIEHLASIGKIKVNENGIIVEPYF